MVPETFVIPQDMKGKEVSLHFEGAMGKQVIYLNGKRVQEHFGEDTFLSLCN